VIPQTPAEGIMLYKDYGPCKMYKVTCECGCDDCSHMVEVDAEETGVVVTTYTTQKTNFWSKNRWQLIWTLLTKGYVEYEASICMSKQQALNYSEVLKSAVKDVEQFQAVRKSNSEIINKIASKLAQQGDCE
jgi:hypothetical protein